MQYAAYKVGDAVDLKRRVAEYLAALGTPDFGNRVEPHAMLAGLPLRVYMTTNYDDFMLTALTRAGKDPVRIVCPWYEGSVSADPETVGEPPVERPVVYHLHGSGHDPRTMVLTEDDYLEFLIRLVASHQTPELPMIPTSVLPALTARPLLFIGYALHDWTFRVIFQTLLRTVAKVQQRRHVSVQLQPLAGGRRATRGAQEYLTHYFDQWNISVFWGSAADFCGQLRARLDAA
jgi:hypothetical protein